MAIGDAFNLAASYIVADPISHNQSSPTMRTVITNRWEGEGIQVIPLIVVASDSRRREGKGGRMLEQAAVTFNRIPAGKIFVSGGVDAQSATRLNGGID